MEERSSIIGASLWMLVITALLFWLPAIGPLLGGIVGGKKAGDTGRAIMAAILPAVVVGGALFIAGGALTGVPLLGAVAGIGAGVAVLTQIGPLLLGAIIGSIL